MLNKSYKFRIYPNKSQEILINKTFGTVRKYWNECVAAFNGYHKDYCPKPIYQTSKQFREKYRWAKEVSASPLQQKFRDFLKAKSQFFNKGRKSRLGRMKFKPKHNSRNSYRLPNQKFDIRDNKIKIEKIGLVRFDNHRDLPKNSRTLSITVSGRNGKYYASICFQFPEPTKHPINNPVGLDLGLKTLATSSENKVYGLPDFTENQSKIRKLQKHLSRKKKGSNRYKRCKLKLALAYEKLVAKRDFELHNISRVIVDNFGTICLETLNIEQMKTNISKINHKIQNTCLSKFIFMLEYKTTELGNQVIKVDKWFPSSQICSNCGDRQKLRLDQREYSCNCGMSIDRDHNAAKNILDEGLRISAGI